MDVSTFTNTRRQDQTYEAIIILAGTPGKNAGRASSRSLHARAPSSCEGNMVDCPLADGCTIAGNPPRGYNPTPTLNPVSGANSPHWGVDLVAPQGTDVLAAADGEVVYVHIQQPTNKGYGQYMELLHSDGSESLYAHLTAGSPLPVGTEVKKGQVIASSGGTKNTPGAGGSTGPHLHFEYWIPNPDNPSNPNDLVTTDPFPCIRSSSLTGTWSGNWSSQAQGVCPSFSGTTTLMIQENGEGVTGTQTITTGSGSSPHTETGSFTGMLTGTGFTATYNNTRNSFVATVISNNILSITGEKITCSGTIPGGSTSSSVLITYSVARTTRAYSKIR